MLFHILELSKKYGTRSCIPSFCCGIAYYRFGRLVSCCFRRIGFTSFKREDRRGCAASSLRLWFKVILVIDEVVETHHMWINGVLSSQDVVNAVIWSFCCWPESCFHLVRVVDALALHYIQACTLHPVWQACIVWKQLIIFVEIGCVQLCCVTLELVFSSNAGGR